MKRHNIEFIIKVLTDYIKIISYIRTQLLACNFAVLDKFYNTFNLTESTHARGRDANKVRGEAECFIFYVAIARARPCYNCFKEFIHERLVNTYPFRSITESSIKFVISGS